MDTSSSLAHIYKTSVFSSWGKSLANVYPDREVAIKPVVNDSSSSASQVPLKRSRVVPGNNQRTFKRSKHDTTPESRISVPVIDRSGGLFSRVNVFSTIPSANNQNLATVESEHRPENHTSTFNNPVHIMFRGDPTTPKLEEMATEKTDADDTLNTKYAALQRKYREQKRRLRQYEEVSDSSDDGMGENEEDSVPALTSSEVLKLRRLASSLK